MILRTMLFDVGGTLETYSFTKEYRVKNTAIFRKFLAENGLTISVDDEELCEIISSGIRAYRKWSINSMIELSTDEIWAEYVFKDIQIDLQKIRKISEQLSCLYELYFYIREMRPEAPAVLAEIKKMGLRIGCISNTQSVTQVPATLEKYGISSYFDPVVLSSVYGRRKPDPAIFYQAARLANTPTSACGYIGDKINRDVLGSRKAGFQLAVQIRHLFDDGEQDTGAEPDAIIESLAELLPLIEKASLSNAGSRKTSQHHIKAIFFDAGDILYYRPERDKHLNEFLSQHQLNLAAGFEQERKRIKDLAFSGQMKRHDYYRELIRLHGITDNDEIEKGLEALSRDDNTVAIIEGVPETINELKSRGFLMGIITDTAMPFSRKLNWFDEHGFGRVWDVVISSKEIGVRKPAPEMYVEALTQSGILPDEAVFVGHKTSELTGAKAVGFTTIAFNYDADAPADIYIDKFCELTKLPLLDSREV